MNDSQSPVVPKETFLSTWRYKQYRFVWFSALFAYAGRWIETTVSSWLILQLTNSPTAVGLLQASRFGPMLFGPFCGTIADRFGRQRILVIAQAVYCLGALIIMLLFIIDGLSVWHLYTFIFISGFSFTFDYSTRYAFVSELIPKQNIVPAVSFILMLMNGTSVLGPLVGGVFYDVIGADGSFALVAASFSLSFISLVILKVKNPVITRNAESIWQNLVAGFRYIKNDRALAVIILLAALVNLFVFPYRLTLIPVFAHDILRTDSTGYGILMASTGFGAMIGSMITASIPSSMNKGNLLVISIIAWPAILIGFALSGLYAVSLTLLLLTGVAQGIAMALIQALILTRSSEEMRGRVSGARAMAIGTLPFGSLLAGAGASIWGAPTILITITVTSIIITVLLVIWAPELRT
jgi:MFS family permease